MSASYDLKLNKLLPPCTGPKLGPYIQHNAPIEFLDLLSAPEGGHGGHVFKVKIEGKTLALKIVQHLNAQFNRIVTLTFMQFRFFDLEDFRKYDGIMSTNVSDKTVTFHTDPFFSECRAYGRINEYYKERQMKAAKSKSRTQNNSRHKKKNTKRGVVASRFIQKNEIAVRCLGYIAVESDPYEEIITQKFPQIPVCFWNRSKKENPKHPSLRQPLRALVKEYIDSKSNIVNPATMLKHIKTLTRIGVYPTDIKADNYKCGLLVDFDAAWTEPYWMLDLEPSRRASRRREGIIHSQKEEFDQMIKQSGIKTTAQALPDWERNKLRTTKLLVNII